MQCKLECCLAGGTTLSLTDTIHKLPGTQFNHLGGVKYMAKGETTFHERPILGGIS